MATLQTVPLGPWPKGMNNLVDPTAVGRGALVEAVNVDIGPEGAVTQRMGYAPIGTNVHSLFQFGNRTLGVVNDTVAEIYEAAARSLGFTVAGPVTWGTLTDRAVFTNTSVLGCVSGERAYEIGMDPPVVTMLSTATPPAEYLTAVAAIDADGTEGPLSAAVPAGPDAVISIVANGPGRVYMTRKNGEVFYDIGAFVTGASMYRIPDMPPYGRPCESHLLSRMPGGHYVRYWRGRLLVARGRTLYFSMPLRYGMYDPSFGFVKFEGKIDFIESIENGVFVAVAGQGVYYLAGDEPAKWERKLIDVTPAQPGAVTLIPTVQLRALNLPSPAAWAAVWFTDKGFALGLSSGLVVYPQADRLSGLPLGTGTLQFKEGRLIVLSQ
jgi:hypothetical protein